MHSHKEHNQQMKTELIQPNEKRMIKGLGAHGPDPKMREKLMLFGQFVGDWDIIESRYLQPDGTWSITRGELHWGWILGGKAVQDVWMTIEEKTGRPIPDGTTVRFYDPKIDAWRSTWLSPTQHVVRTFIGRLVDDQIVLDATDCTGDQSERWIFSQIAPNSFRWHAEEKKGREHEWVVTEEMSVRRRGPPGP